MEKVYEDPTTSLAFRSFLNFWPPRGCPSSLFSCHKTATSATIARRRWHLDSCHVVYLAVLAENNFITRKNDSIREIAIYSELLHHRASRRVKSKEKSLNNKKRSRLSLSSDEDRLLLLTITVVDERW